MLRGTAENPEQPIENTLGTGTARLGGRLPGASGGPITNRPQVNNLPHSPWLVFITFGGPRGHDDRLACLDGIPRPIVNRSAPGAKKAVSDSGGLFGGFFPSTPYSQIHETIL